MTDHQEWKQGNRCEIPVVESAGLGKKLVVGHGEKNMLRMCWSCSAWKNVSTR